MGDFSIRSCVGDQPDISGTLENLKKTPDIYISESTEGTELACGINWAYTSTHSESMDAQSIFPLIELMIVLMLLTGYLIIYNVFQIRCSVRFNRTMTANPADLAAGTFIVRDRNSNRTDLRVSDRKYKMPFGHHIYSDTTVYQ